MKSTETSRRIVRWQRILIDPARLWIRFVPRSWPWPREAVTDLRRPTLHAARRGVSGSFEIEAELNGLDDVVWIPPVAGESARSRAELADHLSEQGIPWIDHRLPGGDSEASSGRVVVDVLSLLMPGKVDELSRVPGDSWVLWPLIPGVTDRPRLVERGLRLLRESRVRGVHGLALELTARQRRMLAEQGGEDVFDALFHGARSSERAFAAQAHGAGLEVFLARPTPRAARLAGNRTLAGALHRAGLLWTRLQRSPAQGEAFLAAARRIDESGHDIGRIIQEGNLGIVDWLSPEAREILQAVAMQDSKPKLLSELEREYLGSSS